MSEHTEGDMDETTRMLARIEATPGPTKAERITPAPKGHVPDERLPRYRHLRDIGRHLKAAADMMGAEFGGDTNVIYERAGFFFSLANDLREELD